MGEVLNLKTLKDRFLFESRLDIYVDGDGHESIMRWIPPFRSCRALTNASVVTTPSGTVGDYFLPSDIQPSWVPGVDYDLINMGGFWADMFLCSSWDATSASAGTIASGLNPNQAYISQPGVAPRVGQNIAHFKTYLASRFATGGFAGGNGTGWAGKGGLMLDQYWFEMFIWTRIHRHLLHGNTAGYANETATPSVPKYHGDVGEIGVLDPTNIPGHGTSLTGSGPKNWDVPVSDFCGNRWEFTDGLRIFNGRIYSAGKKLDPLSPYSSADYTTSGINITGITNGQSVASYRVDAWVTDIAKHGIPATGTTAGAGPFDGQGFWFSSTGETIALRGGYSGDGALCPGAVDVGGAPSHTSWAIGARAVLVP